MRQLVIVCEGSDVVDVQRAVDLFAHPHARKFVTLATVNLRADPNTERFRVIDACRTNLAGTTNPSPLVAAPKEVGRALMLSSTLRPFEIQYEEHSRAMLIATFKGSGTPVMHKMLNTCGLSVRSAIAESLANWAHQRIDAQAINAWVGQFAALGVSQNIPNAILASLRLVSQAELGDMLCAGPSVTGKALCVNHDERTHGKSGDVIANLLVKRFKGENVFKAPADAVDAGHKDLVVYEDGLFTGTEAVGILESLLGRRDKAREKTRVLTDPKIFPRLQLTLSYGLGTDYGIGLVQRFLQEQAFANVTIRCAEPLTVAPDLMLQRLSAGDWPVTVLWEAGPPDPGLNAHFLNFAASSGRLAGAELSAATAFCSDVGRQLFFNYTQEMKARKADYRDWPSAKLDKCGLGMWGQGLTLAFGHSIPKAAVPLLWGKGAVTYGGKALADWAPLFPNAW